MYTPLYPPEGMPVSGFQCRKCKKVTRTERGMRSHLLVVHNLRVQMEFNFDGQGKQTTDLVRVYLTRDAERARAGAGPDTGAPGDPGGN